MPNTGPDPSTKLALGVRRASKAPGKALVDLHECRVVRVSDDTPLDDELESLVWLERQHNGRPAVAGAHSPPSSGWLPRDVLDDASTPKNQWRSGDQAQRLGAEYPDIALVLAGSRVPTCTVAVGWGLGCVRVLRIEVIEVVVVQPS